MAIWVLVADNSRARFFTAEKPAGPLTETRDLANPEARLHEGDLVSDKTGRDRNPSTGTAHGVGADASHKQEGADRFALHVCDELDAARAAGDFHKLYILAAPAFLGLLRKHQSAPLKQTIVAELDKNLATQDPAAIRKHLPEYL
jgi:protein required for attachment to host cells